MNLRLLLCGVLGGLLGAVLLSLPLYLVLPGEYSPAWPTLHPAFGILGYVLAALAWLGTGFLASTWGWADSSKTSLRLGSQAGMLATLIAFPLIVAPAGAVVSQAPIWMQGAVPAASERDASYIVCECVVRAGWFPYMWFWSMLLAGAALGLAGGALANFAGRPRWGALPPGIADEGCDSSIAIMILASLDLVAILPAITLLMHNCAESALKHQLPLSLPPRGILDWPVLTHLVVLIVATWYCGRWCADRWLHPVAGVRKIAILCAIIMSLLPCGLLAGILQIAPELFADPLFQLGASVWVGVVLYCLLRVGRPASRAAWNSAPPSPSFRDRLLINAGFLGAIVPTLVMVGGVSQALAMALGIVPYLGLVFPQTDVALPTQSSQSEAPPNAVLLIQQIYVVHFLCSLYLAVFWMIVAAVHAGAVLLWQRARRGAPTVPRPTA